MILVEEVDWVVELDDELVVWVEAIVLVVEVELIDVVVVLGSPSRHRLHAINNMKTGIMVFFA